MNNFQQQSRSVDSHAIRARRGDATEIVIGMVPNFKIALENAFTKVNGYVGSNSSYKNCSKLSRVRIKNRSGVKILKRSTNCVVQSNLNVLCRHTKVKLKNMPTPPIPFFIVLRP